MRNEVELLAPAGDWQAFLGAVENGADAVYLGGRLFNARQSAGNFDTEQLKKALDYAHVRDVKIYLTLNTLILESEMAEAVDFAGDAYVMGIDGLIVQDLGLAANLRKLYPQLPLHASTQMTLYNPEGVRMAEKLGFSRAVLARELSLEEIAQVARNTGLELEVFVHGALCISYSGQCLMSSMIGGRSGNRGRCAQPCRLPYQLINPEGKSHGAPEYLLSPRDLCGIEDLGGLAAAGVRSLKIEGRMKGPEYVATVVRIYRKYLDRMQEKEPGRNLPIEPEDRKDLTQIFNRGGFSRGYLAGKPGRDLMCYQKPKNWGVPLGTVLAYDGGQKVMTLKLEDTLSLGDGLEVWHGMGDSPGTVVTDLRTSGRHVQQALAGTQAEIWGIRGDIQKGDRVYRTSEKRLNVLAMKSLEEQTRRVGLKAAFRMKTGEPVRFLAADDRGNRAEALGRVPEQALHRELDRERAFQQLSRTGGTPFVLEDVSMELEAGLTVPVSELNALRREVLEKLEAMRISVHSNRSKSFLPLPQKAAPAVEPQGDTAGAQLSLCLYRLHPELDLKALEVDRLYIPFRAFLDGSAKELLKNRKPSQKIYIWVPSITRGNYDKLIRTRLKELMGAFEADGVLAGNPGVLEAVGSLPAAADYGFNVVNRDSIRQLQELGMHSVTLSPELSLQQVKGLAESVPFPLECLVYGRLPLMTSEYCPAGSVAGGCDIKTACRGVCTRGDYRLRDRKGMEFPVWCDKIDCRTTVFNANTLFVPDLLTGLDKAGVGMMRLNITDEGPERVQELVVLHRDALKTGDRALEKHRTLVNAVRDAGFTRGHYMRGV